MTGQQPRLHRRAPRGPLERLRRERLRHHGLGARPRRPPTGALRPRRSQRRGARTVVVPVLAGAAASSSRSMAVLRSGTRGIGAKLRAVVGIWSGPCRSGSPAGVGSRCLGSRAIQSRARRAIQAPYGFCAWEACRSRATCSSGSSPGGSASSRSSSSCDVDAAAWPGCPRRAPGENQLDPRLVNDLRRDRPSPRRPAQLSCAAKRAARAPREGRVSELRDRPLILLRVRADLRRRGLRRRRSVAGGSLARSLRARAREAPRGPPSTAPPEARGSRLPRTPVHAHPDSDSGSGSASRPWTRSTPLFCEPMITLRASPRLPKRGWRRRTGRRRRAVRRRRTESRGPRPS